MHFNFEASTATVCSACVTLAPRPLWTPSGIKACLVNTMSSSLNQPLPPQRRLLRPLRLLLSLNRNCFTPQFDWGHKGHYFGLTAGSQKSRDTLKIKDRAKAAECTAEAPISYTCHEKSTSTSEHEDSLAPATKSNHQAQNVHH